MVDFAGPALTALTAVEVRALLKSREISPQDLLDASKTRIKQTEPEQNAMARTVADCALFLDVMQGVQSPISFPAPATSFLSEVEAASR